MCGIIFIYSKNNQSVKDYISNSFKLILNRGYDAIGITYKDNNNKYIITKKIKPNENTIEEIVSNLNTNMILGHSRWVTNGINNIENAHPHISMNGKVILVHNGIIHNCKIIKDFLIEQGWHFYGETDTEVIVNLIEYYIISRNLNIIDAIKITNKEIKGTWALIIICTTTHKIYFTKHSSPLLISENNDFIISTSESSGFNSMVNNFIAINDYDIFELNNGNNNIKSVYNYEYNLIPITNIIKLDNLDNENYWMIKEIKEQPKKIQDLFDIYIDNYIIKFNFFKNNIDIENIKYIVIIGCGTSFNAGLLGEKYFNSSFKYINVRCYDACEFRIKYLPNVKNKKEILCIFLSQSGETIDVYNCIKECKKNGCINIAILNKENSLIARTVDYYINIHAGNEIAVASTKSFINMIITLSLLELYLKKDYDKQFNVITDIKLLPNAIISMLYNISFINKIYEISKIIHDSNIQNIFILGKDSTLPIAIEGALKIKEITYIHAEAFSYGSLKHGPLALIDNTNYTIILVDYNDKDNYHLFKTCYNEIISRNTNVILIINNEQVIKDIGFNNLYIIIESLNYFNEIFFAICLQYLSFNISIMKSINPDKPRNLAKVVTVE